MESIPAVLWTPSRNRVAIDSSLAMNVLLSRLSAGFADEFRGRVEGNGVKVWRSRDFAASRGSFAPLFYGVVIPTATGSRLAGHFQMHPMTRLYTGAWIGLSVLLASIFLVASALRSTPDASAADALPVLLVALLPLAGLLLVHFQQRNGRADEQVIRAWITRRIEGIDQISER